MQFTSTPKFGAGTKMTSKGLYTNQASKKAKIPEKQPAVTACVETSKYKPNRKAGTIFSKMPFCTVISIPKSADVVKLPATMQMAVMRTETTLPNLTVSTCEAPGRRRPWKTSTESAFATPERTESAVDMIAAISAHVSNATTTFSTAPWLLSSKKSDTSADSSCASRGHDSANVAFITPAMMPGHTTRSAPQIREIITHFSAMSDLAMYTRCTM
mmetsp:Transcript_46354/g.148883  ORF Transcript_46354/g.148883 Transcript_46354/m.148883 type:complete len:215 (+) Transcript_46354:1049-1693(+)